MLEWVCTKCNRSVDPAFTVCPFCKEAEAAATAHASAPPRIVKKRIRRPRQPFNWAQFDSGFRIGLGFVAAVSCAYFVLFLIAFFGNHAEWVDKLGRWLRLH